MGETDIEAPIGLWRRHGVKLLIAVLTAGGAPLAVAEWGWEVVSPNAGVSWIALAVLFAVAESCVVHVHVDRQAHTFSLSEIPIVLGLAYATPAGLLAGRLTGSLFALWAVRRQPLLKILFNLAYFSLDVGVAVTISHLILNGGPPAGPRWWRAATAATAGSLLLGSVVVSLVIAAAEG